MPFIVNNLSFDKIYSYENDRPLHVSTGNESERHLQIMNISDKGRRIPRRKAYGNETKILAEELIQWMEKFTTVLVFSHTLVSKIYQYISLMCCELLYYDTYNDTEKLIYID
jgi:hypothetical protein